MRGKPWVDLPTQRIYCLVPICRICTRLISRGGHRVKGKGMVCKSCDRRLREEFLSEDPYEAQPRKAM